MQFDTMRLESDGPVATIVLDRPSKLNCINQVWLDDFNRVLDRVTRDDGIRVIRISGAGRAFCTGIDLSALACGHLGASFFRGWENALRALETMEPVVIAAIHSHCIGGGLQLALACDLRVARDDAKFGVTATKEGILPGIGMWRLARYAGLGLAKRLALTADIIDAPTALHNGVVDYVAAPDEFEARVGALTARALEMAWTSTRLTKKLVNLSPDTSFSEVLEVFCSYQERAVSSAEHQEAMAHRRQYEEARAAARRD